MAKRKDVHPEWVITTFGTLVDGLKAATTSPDTSPIPPRSASSDPGPQVNIGILQRLGCANNTALFAHTPGVRAPLSSTQRASFSVRRDPSTYSPAAFTERWNDVRRRQTAHANRCRAHGPHR